MSNALKRTPRRALSPVRWLAAAVAALSLAAPAFAQAATVNVVAAENFYGDVASQIGGSHVAVKLKEKENVKNKAKYNIGKIEKEG